MAASELMNDIEEYSSKHNISNLSAVVYLRSSFDLEPEHLLDVLLLAALIFPRFPALDLNVSRHLQDFFAQLALSGYFLNEMEEMSSHRWIARHHLEDSLGVRQALLHVLHVL
jgi:hypothetical protein